MPTSKKNSVSLFDGSGTHTAGGQTPQHIGVNFVAQGLQFTLQLLSTVILARLLVPADFGLVAMVAVLVNFIGLFKDAGLAQATIQRLSINHAQISTLFWLNVCISTALAALVVALSPAIAWIYEEPRLIKLSMVLALPIMLSGCGLQHQALLQRNFRFLSIAKVNVVSQLLGTCAGLLSALYGLSYWSLAVMVIVAAATSNLGYWLVSDWRPGRPSRGTGVRQMLRFGANLSAFNFVNFFARNGDNFLVGKFIGVAVLGQYSRAYSLMMLPISQLNTPLSAVLLPTLSALQADADAYRTLFLRYLKWVIWCTAIPIAAASIFGEELLGWLLGAEWQLAGRIFEWLAIASFLQPVVHYNSLLFVSLGRSKRMLRWGIRTSLIILLGFVLSVQGGVIVLAAVYACVVVAICLIQPMYVLRDTPISLTDYWRVAGIPTLLGLLLAVVSRVL